MNMYVNDIRSIIQIKIKKHYVQHYCNNQAKSLLRNTNTHWLLIL